MILQRRNKWGTDRPLYWRFGHFACSGECNAEFPNHHLRNAHDVRFHPMFHRVPVAPTYRTPPQSTLIPVDSPRKRLGQYIALCVRGWWMFLTYNLPSWHFSD